MDVKEEPRAKFKRLRGMEANLFCKARVNRMHDRNEVNMCQTLRVNYFRKVVGR